MSFASLNKVSTMKPGIDTKGMEFEPLKSFAGKTLILSGFFFSNGKYGKAPAIAATPEGENDLHLINVPGWATPQFEKIAEDESLVKAMFDGHCALTNIELRDTGKGNPTTVFEFADC